MFDYVLNMPMKFGKRPLTKYTNLTPPELRGDWVILENCQTEEGGLEILKF